MTVVPRKPRSARSKRKHDSPMTSAPQKPRSARSKGRYDSPVTFLLLFLTEVLLSQLAAALVAAVLA